MNREFLDFSIACRMGQYRREGSFQASTSPPDQQVSALPVVRGADTYEHGAVGRGGSGQTIFVDETAWPLIGIRYEGDIDEREFADLLHHLTGCFERARDQGSRIGLLYDSRRGRSASALIRKMQADWQRDNGPLLGRYGAGVAFVIDSPLVRGLLRAIMWMSRIPSPYVVTATRAEAEEWLESRLAGHGAPLADGGTR